MTSFISTLTQRTLDARRNLNASSAEKSLLITLLSEVQSIGKNQGNRPTTDEEALKKTRSFLSTAQDNLRLYEQSNKTQAAEDTRIEIAILESLLPAALSDHDLLAVIESTVQDQSLSRTAASIKPILNRLKEVFSDRLDSKQASSLIRTYLGL